MLVVWPVVADPLFGFCPLCAADRLTGPLVLWNTAAGCVTPCLLELTSDLLRKTFGEDALAGILLVCAPTIQSTDVL